MFTFLRHLLSDGAGSCGRALQYDGFGILLAHRVHVAKGRLQDRECGRCGQEVVHRLVLDGHGRILKGQKVFHGRLHVTGEPYRPNSIDDGEPLVADAAVGGYVQTPRQVDGPTVRAQPASFDDHFTQAAMFYRSLTYVEQAHIVEAFTFELGKCYEQSIKERELVVLANVDADLCTQVAIGLGLPAPKGKPPKDVFESSALSQIIDTPGPIDGRKIGIIAGADSDLAGVAKLMASIQRLGATPLVTAPLGGVLKSGRRSVIIERTLLTARSIEYDALVVAAGTKPTRDIKLIVLLQEAFRHCKTISAWGDGTAALAAAGIDLGSPGVLVADTVDKSFTDALAEAVGRHRVWERAVNVMASAVAPAP
jgi:catalase